jgi:hypothetical protein
VHYVEILNRRSGILRLARPEAEGQRSGFTKSQQNREFARAQMRVDFGVRFAYKDDAAHPGKLSEGEQHGQENLEEVEEDPSNQAADGAWVQKVSPSSMGPSVLLGGARPG